MARWLNAHYYETRYKPVPIEEHLVCEGKIHPFGAKHGSLQIPTQLSSRDISQGRSSASRQIQGSVHREFGDPVLNAVVSLAYETASMGFGALVFAGSRGMCESDARWISRVMPQSHEVDRAIMDRRMDLLGELRSLSSGVDPTLEEIVLFGVAFHRESSLSAVPTHADLDMLTGTKKM